MLRRARYCAPLPAATYLAKQATLDHPGGASLPKLAHRGAPGRSRHSCLEESLAILQRSPATQWALVTTLVVPAAEFKGKRDHVLILNDVAWQIIQSQRGGPLL